MLMLGGGGGGGGQKTCSEIASESFLSQNLLLHLENQVLWQDLKTTFFFPNDRFGSSNSVVDEVLEELAQSASINEMKTHTRTHT